MATKGDHISRHAKSTPTVAKNRRLRRSWTSSSAPKAAVMKCCGLQSRCSIVDKKASRVGPHSYHHSKLLPPKDVASRARPPAIPSCNRTSKASKPLNRRKASAAATARTVGSRRVNSSRMSAKPHQVQTGTAQFNAAGPNHLPNSAGAKYQAE